MSIFRSRVAAVVAGTAVVVTFGASGAVAARVITGQDIKNDTIQSQDVQNGTLRMRDFNEPVANKLNGLATRVSEREERVAALEAEDEAGVNTTWAPSDSASTILNASSVELRQFNAAGDRIDGGDGTSVEIQNLDLPIQAGRTVEFTYELKGGATYAAGVRVFWEVDGTYYNTNDDAPADAGVDNGDGTFTKSVDIPANGRVGAAGIVFDNGSQGSVIVSDLKISDTPIAFQ